MESVRRQLRENRLIAIAAVEHTDRPIEMPLFDGRISLAAGPPRLALATGAALLPVFARRVGTGFEVEVQDDISAVADDGGDGAMAMMRAFVSRFEAFLMDHPGEWSKWYAG